jgi:hypothetical protein
LELLNKGGPLEDLCISYCRPRNIEIILTWRTLAKLRKLKNHDLSFQGEDTFQSPNVQEIIRHCSRSRKLTTLKLNKTILFGHESGDF